MVPRSEKRFIRLNLITIVVTLLLILAGGIVRSTGSGMGCPDWPKCFDQYVPPTSVSQLPADYKEKYVAQRIAKNERFAKTLDRMGKGHLADSIRHDQSILQPEEFNVSKTWTEYLNRLMGAITGFLLLGLTVLSWKYRKSAARISILSFLNLIIVGFQAWLGSIVVSTNLMPWVVTVHMLLALVILAILVYTYNYAQQLQKETTVIMAKVTWLKVIIFLTIVLSVIQIVLGTEVREAVDAVSRKLLYNNRESWIAETGMIFSYHRDVAIFVLILNLVVYKIVKDKFNGKAAALSVAYKIWIVLIIQIASGLILSNFALPPYAQALHILFSTALFTLQYYLYLLVYRTDSYQQEH
ncbi:COX15/CtaA family protein [Pedobacter metabolipauper]|uniref:Cytochrome c oxidase assembly protein subunit 15 n=1 Tax=Pedobacter metabolipauper TaxID=425513 RepID=A0A4R6SPN9_9SPHI|nr:COX15/CtaA family protein [Pedobacter metabolipauper]TDQ06579.1 cytochrome c oxidase assembly protein subunit 15 [Pedobacter metabolipauper]